MAWNPSITILAPEMEFADSSSNISMPILEIEADMMLFEELTLECKCLFRTPKKRMKISDRIPSKTVPLVAMLSLFKCSSVLGLSFLRWLPSVSLLLDVSRVKQFDTCITDDSIFKQDISSFSDTVLDAIRNLIATKKGAIIISILGRLIENIFSEFTIMDVTISISPLESHF